MTNIQYHTEPFAFRLSDMGEDAILSGITEGYISKDEMPYIGCGVVFYITVPAGQIEKIYEQYKVSDPTNLTVQPWRDRTFNVRIAGYQFMIAAKGEEPAGVDDT